MEMNDYFQSSLYEVCYGTVRLQPLIFQDDILHISTSRVASQAASMRIESVMKSKQLSIHPDKSCFVISSTEDNISRIKAEMDKYPVTYGNFNLKTKKEAKYLGDWIDGAVNTSSILATIRKEKEGQLLRFLKLLQSCRI